MFKSSTNGPKTVEYCIMETTEKESWNLAIDRSIYLVWKHKKEKQPLLRSVQRCNGTTAGPGYLEVLELSMQTSVRTVNSQWGRRIQFLY